MKLLDCLDFRQRAAWQLLPQDKKTWLAQLPEDMFERGLMVLDQENRGIDGRETWTRGVEAAHLFNQDPDVFARWIQQGDLVSLDALMSVILDVRAGRRDHLQDTNKPLWNTLVTSEQLAVRLLLDNVDYPGMVEAAKTRQQVGTGESAT